MPRFVEKSGIVEARRLDYLSNSQETLDWVLANFIHAYDRVFDAWLDNRRNSLIIRTTFFEQDGMEAMTREDEINDGSWIMRKNGHHFVSFTPDDFHGLFLPLPDGLAID
jgi:hypothetical protein